MELTERPERNFPILNPIGRRMSQLPNPNQFASSANQVDSPAQLKRPDSTPPPSPPPPPPPPLTPNTARDHHRLSSPNKTWANKSTLTKTIQVHQHPTKKRFLIPSLPSEIIIHNQIQSKMKRAISAQGDLAAPPIQHQIQQHYRYIIIIDFSFIHSS